MSRRGLLALLLLLLGACQRTSPSEPAPAASVVDAGLASASVPPAPAALDKPDGSTSAVAALPVCHAEGSEPIEAARRYYDGERYEEALSCAAQAAALEPDNAEAHAERGMALAALDRVPEA